MAHRFLDRLQAAAEAARALLEDVYRQYELTATSVELLGRVAHAGDNGCSQTDVAKSLQLAESSVCGLVDKLQAAGLLHRFRSRQDRRRSLLLLSSAGRERLSNVNAAVEIALLDWVASATEQQLEQVTDCLAALLVDRRRHLRWSAAAAPQAVQRDEWSGENADPRLREAG
jgi:DNA-binding MarR family transcriptional regulator